MIDQHVTRIHKKGAIITMVDPAQQIIHARLAAGQDVPVHAYTYSPSFRWPMVGEEWILREENGSWFLDSLLESQNPGTEKEGEKEVHISKYKINIEILAEISAGSSSGYLRAKVGEKNGFIKIVEIIGPTGEVTETPVGTLEGVAGMASTGSGIAVAYFESEKIALRAVTALSAGGPTTRVIVVF